MPDHGTPNWLGLGAAVCQEDDLQRLKVLISELVQALEEHHKHADGGIARPHNESSRRQDAMMSLPSRTGSA
jgi:hypothetical protein